MMTKTVFIMEFGEKRLGNWIVTKYNKFVDVQPETGEVIERRVFGDCEGGLPCIGVKPVSGEFYWEYSALDEMYLSIDGHIDDEFSHNGLQTCLGIMAGFLHAEDPIFYDLYVKCMEVYSSIAEKSRPSTREEELEIIRDMKVQYEFEQESKKTEE